MTVKLFKNAIDGRFYKKPSAQHNDAFSWQRSRSLDRAVCSLAASWQREEEERQTSLACSWQTITNKS